MEGQETDDQGGRSFPEAMNGMPENYNEHEAMEQKADQIDNDDFTDDEEIPTPTQGAELNALIVEACNQVIDLKQERKTINAEIQAVIENLESKGIPRAAFKVTLVNMEMSEDQRQAYDLAMQIARGAVGLPFQIEMFKHLAMVN